jgi:hypothetical protein
MLIRLHSRLSQPLLVNPGVGSVLILAASTVASGFKHERFLRIVLFKQSNIMQALDQVIGVALDESQ